ncbi:hypothetical protein J2O02_18385 (plasmid) [Elizabethkingia anophelis]|uniref:hypothetical protein n=1 Tax=Elizabethkingia anophelis TaxID=1117645 RepID=UPI0020B67490|nr:hypothetical protein [Elizabethkingia anophelis]UTG66792.1 hypothetical protein J2O02_18385 [Elizabethkingia anophelis]
MELTPRDIFIDYLISIDDPSNLDSYFDDCYSFIVGEADKRKIEFEGYLRTKWEESSKTIYEFDEDYFDNLDRKKLYVYLSALYNSEIYSILKDAYDVVEKTPPNVEEINIRIKNLIDSGIDF